MEPDFHKFPGFVFSKCLKILMVSYKTIHKAFRIHKTLDEENPLEIFIHQLPKLYFGL